MRKIAAFLLCIILISVYVPSSALDKGTDIIHNVVFRQKSFDHDFFLEYVLFGKKFTESIDPSYWDYSEEMNNLNIIEYASYLCVDQYNNNYEAQHLIDQNKLDRLRKYVSGLPRSVDEINPNEKDDIRILTPSIHRSFTHRGWEFPYDRVEYGGDAAKGRIREKILLRAVDHVFNFYTSTDDILETGLAKLCRKQLNDNRCKSYAKLVYYIHVLGDCYEDENYKQANGQDNGQKIPLGRRNPGKTIDTTDLISEIIKVCEELFYTNQNNQDRYSELKIQLKKEWDEIYALYRKTGDIDSDEDYELYHERVCSLMAVLMDKMPKLLRNEVDFAEAFSEFLVTSGD